MLQSGTPWGKVGNLNTASSESLSVDLPAWFVWLVTVTRYSARCDSHRLTAQKEKRHRFYGYGCLRTNEKLHNAYLGKSDHLTQAPLEQICVRLMDKACTQQGRSTDPETRT